MQEILVAIAFLALVASPALVAVFPARRDEEDSGGVPEKLRISTLSPSHGR